MIRKIKYLLLFNAVLIIASWVMVVYAYPELPPKIPYWIGIFGSHNIEGAKSAVFFVYPVIQTALNLFILWMFKQKINEKNGVLNGETSRNKKILLKTEVSCLGLIFINIIFIHLERSIILVSHNLEQGVNSFYFYMLFGILLLLIPYYKFRKQLMESKGSWKGRI